MLEYDKKIYCIEWYYLAAVTTKNGFMEIKIASIEEHEKKMKL